MTDDTVTTLPSAPTSTALCADHVSKSFGAVTAVDDVTFDVADRELVALVGPSGCGKSTLLRIIAGLIPAESGRIELAGAVVDDGRHALAPERRHVGLVFQEHALFPHLSVARNVGFGVRSSSGRRAHRVDEMLELVGLSGYGERYPHELSGGERQRVALARALAPEPALMLLDEPFASLDPNLRAQIRNDIVAILRASATPAVFVTHDQNEALAVGDRIAVMRSGRIEQFDTPETVFHHPADRFVAGFMGEADFLDGADVEVAFRTTPESLVAASHPDSMWMVRPDDVELSPDPTGPATVVANEFRGSSWCCTVRLDRGTTVRSTRSHIERLDVGTVVRLAVVAGHRLVPVTDRAVDDGTSDVASLPVRS